MFKKYKKELLLSALLVGGMLWAADWLGDLVVGKPEEITLSAGLMFLGLAIMIVPVLAGTIPSGFLIARKDPDIKPAIFVPAAGAAVGGLVVLLLSAVFMALTPDSVWQTQLNELKGLGMGFFEGMTLEEFKSMTLASLGFGAVFMAIWNFAIGLAGGFIGRTIALGKKG